MSFVDYDDLTARQQTMARLAHPRWKREEFPRFAFWVERDGTLAKKPCRYRLTAEASRVVSVDMVEGWGESLDD